MGTRRQRQIPVLRTQHRLVRPLLQEIDHGPPAQHPDFGRRQNLQFHRFGPLLRAGRHLPRRRREIPPAERPGQRYGQHHQMADRGEQHRLRAPQLPPADDLCAEPAGAPQPRTPGIPDHPRHQPRRDVDRGGRLHGLRQHGRGQLLPRQPQVRHEEHDRRDHRPDQGRAGGQSRLLLPVQPLAPERRDLAGHLLQRSGYPDLLSGEQLDAHHRDADRVPQRQRQPLVHPAAARRPLAERHGRMEHRTQAGAQHPHGPRRIHRRRQTQLLADERHRLRPGGRQQLRLGVRRHLLPRQLRLQGQIPRGIERPLRRQLEIPEQRTLGLLPVGLRGLADVGGELYEGHLLDQQHQMALLDRQGRQRQRLALQVHGAVGLQQGRRDRRRQPAHLHLGALVRAAGKPHVGDLLDDQPRTGRQPAEQPPELRRRHLPEGDDRHVRHRSRAAGRDGLFGALRQQRRHAHPRFRGFAGLDRQFPYGEQTLQLQRAPLALGQQVDHHQIHQQVEHPAHALRQRLLRRHGAG